MCFHYFDIVFLLLIFAFEIECRSKDMGVMQINKHVFKFHQISECERNQFYDMDYFTCLPCDEKNSYLISSPDNFGCQCAPTSLTIALYDTIKRNPICANSCLNTKISDMEQHDNNITTTNTDDCLPILPDHSENDSNAKLHCSFKYVNLTSNQPLSGANFKHIRITATNSNSGENCTICNLQYNFHYLDFCIFNALVKPYLNYNAFWQLTSINGHFSDLKFIAFFCLSMNNATTCNHLANLCVISHFSFDKNSPCSAFLLAQASETLIKYSQLDQQLQMVRPFLFYKKGKNTAKMLDDAVKSYPYSLQENDKHQFLNFFTTVYSMDGRLNRWGILRPNHINLCQLHTYRNSGNLNLAQKFRFGIQYTDDRCQLTLEDIIDLATILGNKQFFNIFLNFTREKDSDKVYLQNLPILIENLSVENQRLEMEDWQLVKRFQLIESHARHSSSISQSPRYEDAHKLQMYKTIRFIEKFEIHYNILEQNRITIPIIKLRYRTIDFNINSSLETLYAFRFRIHFTSRAGAEATNEPIFNEILLTVFLFMALAFAVLQIYNFRRRRPSQPPAGGGAGDGTVVEFCDFASIIEFALLLISNIANVLLIFFVIHISYNSILYLTQKNVTVTLPIELNGRDGNIQLDMLIYAAFILKFSYLCVYFLRLGNIDLFFIDWERPKTCDNNHFNLKNNLETSSVCSSVRTYISENNVSAWRIFFIANEWIHLSSKQKSSIFLQGIFSLMLYKLIISKTNTYQDETLQLFLFLVCYFCVHVLQQLYRLFLYNRMFGDPLQKFVDICSLANISVITLLDSSYGYYIHGRSPHGFSDTDLHSMIMQLQRESQNMCSRRGLLSDSDYQTYIILPPVNLRNYCENLLIPFQKSCNLSQAHLKKDNCNVETASGSNLEKTSIAYNSINRFFCAFIDHAIRDMDYIIKEKTFVEKLLNSEFNNYLTNNKGTFYIDTNYSFGQLFFYGNFLELFLLEVLLLIALFMVIKNLTASVVILCLMNKLFETVFRSIVRQNVAHKALIDKRFLV